MAAAPGYSSARSPPGGGSAGGPLRPAPGAGNGSGQGAGGGRPASTVGGVAGLLESLEMVGSDIAWVPEDEEVITCPTLAKVVSKELDNEASMPSVFSESLEDIFTETAPLGYIYS